MHRRAFLVAGLALISGGAACSRVPPLANPSASAEGLATAVLDALSRRDRARLDALALTEQEFRDHAWPELPAARPERNLPFSYVWGDLHQKSDASLERTLARHGGRRYALVSLRGAGETTKYASYTVSRDTVLRVRDETGGELEVRLFGSTIQKEGAWKVFSWVVDE